VKCHFGGNELVYGEETSSLVLLEIVDLFIDNCDC